VKGVGEKTARDLVVAFPSIEAMLEAAATGGSGIKPAVRANLLDSRDYLATMQRLVPVNAVAPLSLWAGDRDDAGLLADAGDLGLKGPIQRVLAALDSAHAE
jgi:5'-3' exonuclease